MSSKFGKKTEILLSEPTERHKVRQLAKQRSQSTLEESLPPRAFGKVLAACDYTLVESLFRATDTAEYDQVAQCLLEIFSAYGNLFDLIRWCVQRDVANTNTEDGNLLFRGPSITTKLITQYCFRNFNDHLCDLLQWVVEMVCADGGLSLEVDPVKMDPNEVLEDNLSVLIMMSKGILNHIFRTVTDVSPAMRMLFRIIQEEVTQKLPKHKNTGIGGIYFLRFVCPALVLPESYGLLKSPPTAKCRRSLILLSKVLQNLANGAHFGEKEPYMLRVNEFIGLNQPKMVQFLEQLASIEKCEEDLVILPIWTPEGLERALTSMYKLFEAKLPKIIKGLQDLGREDLLSDLNFGMEDQKHCVQEQEAALAAAALKTSKRRNSIGTCTLLSTAHEDVKRRSQTVHSDIKPHHQKDKPERKKSGEASQIKQIENIRKSKARSSSLNSIRAFRELRTKKLNSQIIPLAYTKDTNNNGKGKEKVDPENQTNEEISSSEPSKESIENDNQESNTLNRGEPDDERVSSDSPPQERKGKESTQDESSQTVEQP